MQDRNSRIVELRDEKNYLRNILERADEEDMDVEAVINERIDQIYTELAIAGDEDL